MPAEPEICQPGAEVTYELHADHLGGAVAQEVMQRLVTQNIGPARFDTVVVSMRVAQSF